MPDCVDWLEKTYALPSYQKHVEPFSPGFMIYVVSIVPGFFAVPVVALGVLFAPLGLVDWDPVLRWMAVMSSAFVGLNIVDRQLDRAPLEKIPRWVSLFTAINVGTMYLALTL